LTTLYETRAQAHGWSGEHHVLKQLLHMDIELNAQGLEVWLDRAAT
ncbi:MAG: MBL fold metallo-hydrolase, partial [Rhodanobacter sp.]